MDAATDLLDPDAYARNGYPWQTWAELRRHQPVSKQRHGEAVEYWALVRHADVVAVSRRPADFLSAPRLNMPPRRVHPGQPADFLPETIITMDPPRHARYRALTSRHFTPRALSAFEPRIAELAREIVARAVERFGDGREFDFVDEVSARLPLAVIMELLGVPRADWETLLLLANQTVGSGDPEYNKSGDTSIQTALAATKSIFEHYASYITERRARPRDDLMSVLLRAELDGRRLEDSEVLGYCFLLTAAGNETTRNATSGGMLALLEHPAQLRRLRAEGGWLRAADEIVRWVSPIIHFCRTAAVDAELGGQHIRRGDTLTLFYPSAARDEGAFANPETFDVGRSPNPHVSFGIGEHYCLGARLARLELAAIVREWVTKLDAYELAAPVERLRSIVIGGIKHMRVRIAPAR
ncbi:MAG TPA: cytochrome P450 [Myxococcota bacterium]|nr:cytochrome P450 [Myxococcota bacterium]